MEQNIRRQFQDMARPAGKEYWQREDAWAQFFTSCQGTPQEAFFCKMGIDISAKDRTKKLHDMFFGETGGGGDIFFLVNKVLDTFDEQERRGYERLIRALAQIYGEVMGDPALYLISIDKRSPRPDKKRLDELAEELRAIIEGS